MANPFSWAMILATFHTLGLLSAFHAIWFCRTSQGAIAWSLSLTFFPYLALPAYWAFGRDKFRGYIRDFRAASLDPRVLREDLRLLEEERDQQPPELASMQMGFEKLAHFPLTRANQVELLVDGEETFAAIFAAFEAAEKYLLVEFFIITDDEIGKQFQQNLIKKARQGVKVYLVYDEFGCFFLPRTYLNEMREAGISVVSFAPGGLTKGRLQVNFRNHRKIVVADGKIALVGGFNVSDDSLGKNAFYGNWRDTHVQIMGPAVVAIQYIFVCDYRWASGGEILSGLDFAPKPQPQGQEAALYVATGPADKMDSGTGFFLHSINCARNSIWLATPYFMPTRSVLAALKAAVLRGVEVKVLVPLRRDMLVTYLTSFSYLPEAMEAGVEIFTYSAGYMHQKVMLVDESVAWIGSANFDARSMELNFEGNLVVFGKKFAASVRRMFIRDLERSQPMTIDAYERRSLLFKFGVKLSRLFENIL